MTVSRVKDVTISVIVGMEGDKDQLDDSEEQEAVDNEREHAQDVIWVTNAVLKSGRVHIQGRRPNVAKQNSHALKRQLQRPPPAILQTRIQWTTSKTPAHIGTHV